MEIINELFTDRREYLLECATNSLKLRGKYNNKTLPNDLVTEAYFHITENEEKMRDMILDGKLESIVVRWMKMQIVWNKTRFKKMWIYDDFRMISTSDESFIDSLLVDTSVTEEEVLENEKFVTESLTLIREFIKTQTMDQQFLFEDYYINGFNSSGKLAKHTGLPRTACYYLIKRMKDNLKEYVKTMV